MCNPTTYVGDTPVSGRSKVRREACIRSDVRFYQLVKNRRIFSWSLTAAMLIAYFAFILTIAFAPNVLATPISPGHPTTWGIPVGFGMFIFTFMLVGIYVYRANTVYDGMVANIVSGGK